MSQRATVTNPILPGFNPDPSIVRVGEDYYIATSTFEWYPGVQIHHSRDLAHWRLVSRPLNRASQLNMLGDPDSGGIWAPCLTHDKGKFYLVYTDLKRYGRAADGNVAFRDMHNYVVTSSSIDGHWSDPIYMNASGFDPSLFHDEDGRRYFVNMVWDHRAGKNPFGGIALQEFSESERRLIGERKIIFTGTEIGFTEAPHLYRRNGYYYLITAEGGTGFGHAVTMARSKNIAGPYELHPDKYVLSARHRPDAALQRAGHADLVETPQGETYMVYLCGRPIANRGRCTLGRETAMQPMRWSDDGWLRTLDGQGLPMGEFPAPALSQQSVPQQSLPAEPVREHFDSPELPRAFQWLRSPFPEELFSLKDRPGHLRLFGRESPGSVFRQALVARRQDSHCYSAGTTLQFEPRHFQQLAGLICYYNTSKYHYLHVSHDEQLGKYLRVMTRLPDQVRSFAQSEPIAIASGAPLELRVEVDFERLHFGYRVGDGPLVWLPQQLDASILSDEATEVGAPNFTGAFVGMACQDLSGAALPADFDYFDYRPRGYEAGAGRGRGR